MPKPLTSVTLPTRLILRTLVNADGQLWTGQVAALAEVRWGTAFNVLNRLLEAEWVESNKESAEEAAQRVSAPRRYWELTEEGRIAALEVIGTRPEALSSSSRVAARTNEQQPNQGDLGLNL